MVAASLSCELNGLHWHGLDWPPPPPDIHHQVCTLHYLRQMAKQFWCLCDCSLKWAGLLSVIASFRVTTRGCGGEQRWDVFILVCTAVTHDHSCDCSVVRQILSGVSHWSHMVLCHSNGILLIVCLSAKCNWTRNAETTVQNLPLCKHCTHMALCTVDPTSWSFISLMLPLKEVVLMSKSELCYQ